MTVPLTTSPGGLFRRLGRTIFGLNSLSAMLGNVDLSGAGIASLGTIIDNIQGQFQSSDQDVFEGLYSQRDRSRQTSFATLLADVSGFSGDTVRRMVDDDTVLFPSTLANAVSILIAQMKGASQTVKANVVSATTGVGGSNTGNAVVRASVIGPDGKNREYLYPEVLNLKCTGDSQSGSATAGSEPFAITGDAPAVAGLLGWDFPGGSGTNGSIIANDPANGQIVTDGAFEQWSGSGSNTLTNWTATTGVYGTDIFRESANKFRGTYGVKVLSDGSTLSCLAQSLASTLRPSTVYAVNFWVKMSAMPSAGALSCDLFDGSSIINDDAGNANQITKALTAVGASWVAVGGYFRTPALLPAIMKIRLRLTTAIDNTKSLYLDDLAFLAKTPLYTGGLYVDVFPGNVPSVKNDTMTVTVANDLGGKIQTGCWRLLNMPSLGPQLAVPKPLQLPSVTDASETCPDSLVY